MWEGRCPRRDREVSNLRRDVPSRHRDLPLLAGVDHGFYCGGFTAESGTQNFCQPRLCSAFLGSDSSVSLGIRGLVAPYSLRVQVSLDPEGFRCGSFLCGKEKDFNRFIDHLVVSITHLRPAVVIPNGVPDELFHERRRNMREEWGVGDQCFCFSVSLLMSTAKIRETCFAGVSAGRHSRHTGVCRAGVERLQPGAIEGGREMRVPRGGSRVLILEDRGGDFVRDCYAASGNMCSCCRHVGKLNRSPFYKQRWPRRIPSISRPTSAASKSFRGESWSPAKTDEMAEALMKQLAGEPGKLALARHWDLPGAAHAGVEHSHRWESVVQAYASAVRARLVSTVGVDVNEAPAAANHGRRSPHGAADSPGGVGATDAGLMRILVTGAARIHWEPHGRSLP